MSELEFRWNMKIRKSVRTNCIGRLLLIVPVTCLITACSGLPGSVSNHPATENQVRTYVVKSQEKVSGHPVEADPDPTYEWFY
jgi:hypothetical protein